MSNTKQSGFAVVEALLVVIILGLIGGTGYYVWHSKQAADKTLTAASNNTPGGQPALQHIAKPASVAANWLTYTAPSGHYSVRLADGWKLERYKQSDGLYTFDAASTRTVPGTKATVTEVEGGRDGSAIGLFIGYISLKDETTAQPKGTVTGTFKTDQGITVTSYTYTETSAANADNLESLPKGGIIYSYTAAHGDGIMLVAYGIGPGDPDQHATVEQSVKTFMFN